MDVDICPLIAWRKCYEDGYSAIRRNKEKGNAETDYEAFDLLYRTFVARIGHEPEFESYLETMKAYNIACAAYVKSRKKVNGVTIHDRSKQNRVHILKAKLDKFEKDGDSTVSIQKVLNRLTKMQGVQVKESDLTVLAYFELIKDYKQWQKGE